MRAEKERTKICFLGAGNMGEALIRGVLTSGLYGKDQVIATDVSSPRLKEIQRRYGISVTEDNRAAAAGCQVIVLAVKPGMIGPVAKEIAPVMEASKLLITIAAGVSLQRLGMALDPDREDATPQLRKGGGKDRRQAQMIRVMPNTPALLCQGISALAPGPGTSTKNVERAIRILESVGKTVVLEEHQMNAVTGLSGSGPAFVFMAIEAMADGGVKMGLPRDVALLLSAQTVLGSAAMVLQTGEHPARLKDRVASPGGTTIAGLHHLERCGFRSALIGAVESATIRSEELGKMPDTK